MDKFFQVHAAGLEKVKITISYLISFIKYVEMTIRASITEIQQSRKLMVSH